MSTDIEEGSDLAGGVADHQHRVLAHVCGEEIAGVGYLALMAQKQPTAGEDALQLFLVDIVFDEDTPAD